MHISLLIRLQTNEMVSWATYDRKGRITNSATNVPLTEIPTDNHQPLVLIPTTDVILTQADIPSNKRQKIIQAVPYALEEQLIDEIENLHFVIEKSVSKNIQVAVIAKTCLEEHLKNLHAAGFKPKILMPDVLALPYFDDNWTVMYLDDIVLVRTGLKAGFAIEIDNLIITLQMAITENPPAQITVINHDLTDLQALGIPLQVAEKNILEGTNVNFNLLQGPYRPQNNSWLRPWLVTIVLGIIWGGLYVTEQIIEYQYLTKQRLVLNQQIEKIYQDTFPESRRIVNPRVQMEQKLTVLRNQQDINEVFLSNLNKMAPILKAIPNLTLKQIDFRQQKFDLHIIVDNFQVLEKLQTNLNKLDLNVKIKSASSRKQKVESRLQISIK
ncbi:type II secretion system protein GspL [Candidatus Halobeggiatoa sp. HSG11]|nr:type II secretion system protein GspL [Candidatus Halobeggiatoa sp. HSG11]